MELINTDVAIVGAGGAVLRAAIALVLLFLLVAMGQPPAILGYASLHQFAGHWLGKLSLFGVIALFLWHAAHRLRVTVHDFGLRQDTMVAVVVYCVAALGTALTALALARI